MTEADILQAIPGLIECAPEALESTIEYIRNTEQYHEFIEALDNTEDVIEKLKEMLRDIAEKKPHTVNLAVHSELAPLQSSVELTVIPPKA